MTSPVKVGQIHCVHDRSQAAGNPIGISEMSNESRAVNAETDELEDESAHRSMLVIKRSMYTKYVDGGT